MNSYPEHEKAAKIKLNDSQAVGFFVDWLFSTYRNSDGERLIPGDYHVHTDECKDKDGEYNRCGLPTEFMMPSRYDINAIIAEYFHIDYKKLMAEKDQMLNEIREANK